MLGANSHRLLNCIAVYSDSNVFLTVLKECCRARDLERGREVHAAVVESGAVSNICVMNKLIDMYSKCGCMQDAWDIFESMVERNVVSWNALMLGYVHKGEEQLVFRLFLQMKAYGFAPDSWTYVALLKACASLAGKEEGSLVDGKLVKLRALETGMAIHAEAVEGCCATHFFVANMLMDVYANCGCTSLASVVFNKSRFPSVVSWNTLMLGYAENGEEPMAFELFEHLTAGGFSPDGRTFVAAFKACASMAMKEDHKLVGRKLLKPVSLEKTMALHSEAEKTGCHSSLFVSSILVDAYAQCGSLSDARRVFEKLSCCDVVTWNALILGYAEQGEAKLALELFSRMQAQGNVQPNARTFVGVLTACIWLASLETGRAVHADICSKGIEGDAFLGSCLLDLYAKCGSLDAAQRIFDTFSCRDLMFWSPLLAGYSHHGQVPQALDLFQKMREERVQLDGIVFLSVLTACNHAGLVDKGKKYFKTMVSEYRIQPIIEHYHCLLDILGRANKLDEAVSLVETMPFKPTEITWKTILSSCLKWNNLKIGKLAFESLMELDPRQSAGYSLMANIYGTTAPCRHVPLGTTSSQRQWTEE